MNQFDVTIHNLLRPLKNPMIASMLKLAIIFYAFVAAPPLPGQAKSYLQHPAASFVVGFLVLYTSGIEPSQSVLYASIFAGALFFIHNQYPEGFCCGSGGNMNHYKWTNHPGFPLNPYGTAQQLNGMGYNPGAEDAYPNSIGGEYVSTHAMSPQGVWDNCNIEAAGDTKEQFSAY